MSFRLRAVQTKTAGNRFWILITCICVPLSGCAPGVREAKIRNCIDGFLTDVNKGDWDASQTWWTIESIAAIEANWEMPYSKFAENFVCKEYTITDIDRGKVGVYSAKLNCSDKNDPGTIILYLEKIHGRWLLSQDYWIDPGTD